MMYFELLKQSVETMGGQLLTSKEVLEKEGLVCPDTLAPEKREALRADIELAIRANNSARSSSLREAAHYNTF